MKLRLFEPTKCGVLALLVPAFLMLTGISECSSQDSDSDGWSVEDGDCNDNDASIHPGAQETCDGVDQDCDGAVDDNPDTSFYLDVDGDGYGSSVSETHTCTAPDDGYVEDGGDCDDTDKTVYPGATETCDGVDQDCDGEIDNDVTTALYYDGDGDTYGSGDSTVVDGCDWPASYVDEAGDCDDANSAVNPAAAEVCDGIDQDCDTVIDDGVLGTWYLDADADNYGDASSTTAACSKPEGYVSSNTDCNDGDATVHPGATEVCDGVDQDCDSTTDEDVLLTFYLDADGDSYGLSSDTTTACSTPTGYASDGDDCDDVDATVYPGASEAMNEIDDDCDGTVDEVIPESVDGGYYHALALRSNGAVWAWGRNDNGQVGDGTTTTATLPVRIRALSSTAVAVAAGATHSLALLEDGTVWAWGGNTYGQLGDGSKTTRTTPVEVTGLTGVIAIAAGEYHSLALTSDGKLWAWGYNNFGQLGDNSKTTRTSPVQVTSISEVSAIAAGAYFTLAVRSDGTVWSWGTNSSGQLGNGTTTSSQVPLQVSNLTDVVAVEGGYSHSLALKSDGTVWAWGNNNVGQLGDGTSGNTRTTAVQVTNLSSVTIESIEAGAYHSLAVGADGSALAWGRNSEGQLGDGTTTNRTSPVSIPTLSEITELSGGYYYSLGQSLDGNAYAFGSNKYGQLGNGTYTNSPLPIKVQGLE